MSFNVLVVLAAEAAEPSKTAFYLGGGILVGWAVLLAAVGLMRPDFPQSESATRGLYGLSALLVLAAAATAVLSG